MTAITARLRRTKPAPIAVSDGKPIRFRLIQSVLWGVVVAACGAALVAGLYFNILQVNWHIAFGHFHHQFFYLKSWWDGTAPYHGGMGNLITSPNWTLYRHGIRDLGEPALATIAVKTLLAKRSTWKKRCGPVSLVVRLILVAAVTIALAVGGIWAINFGLPKFYAVPAWVVKASLEQLALGIVIGQIVHRVWAPAGATLQGYFIDRSVERSVGSGRIPLWVRLPIAPVQVRERFALLRENEEDVITGHSLVLRVLLSVLAVLTVYLVVTGFIAHYWIGAGHYFPYLSPTQ